MVSILSVVLFVVTLTLVIWQPRGLSIAWPAVFGAAAALASGVVTWTDVIAVTDIVWNATLTFLALIVISLLLDELGFFEWSALHMVRFAGGSGVRLFLFTIVLGALVSCFFANDGAALILTPIVLAQVRALKLPAPMIIPFVMASGFIADTTSIPLMISNLVNIVSADFFHLSFTEYASVMLLPNVFSLLASTGMLYLYYRKRIPAGYDRSLASRPAAAVRNASMFRMAWLVLALLFTGYLFSEALHVPVSLIAWAAALSLALPAHRSGLVKAQRLLKEAPWSIVFFSIGMYVVVYGLKNTGFTQWISGGIEAFSRYGPLAAAMGMGFLSALMSSIMNNLPSVMVGALAIDGTQTEGVIRETLIYANVIGCDLGPKITPIGSLATLIWLHILARKDVRVGWGAYFKTGIVLTVPTLIATLLGLYFMQTLILLE